jgi:hypothetical protein
VGGVNTSLPVGAEAAVAAVAAAAAVAGPLAKSCDEPRPRRVYCVTYVSF